MRVMQNSVACEVYLRAVQESGGVNAVRNLHGSILSAKFIKNANFAKRYHHVISDKLTLSVLLSAWIFRNSKEDGGILKDVKRIFRNPSLMITVEGKIKSRWAKNASLKLRLS